MSQIPKDYVQLKNSKWDGKNKIIENVAKGSKPNDVATMSQIPKDNLQLKDGKWNGDNKVIENVAEGTKPNDVLTFSRALKEGPDDDFFTADDKRYKFIKLKTVQNRHYDDEYKLVQKDHFWDGNNLVLRNIHKGYFDTDAVRLDQVLECDYVTGAFYDAKDKPIRHIKTGTQYGDAIVFEQAVRIEDNELYWFNTKLDLYFNDSNGDQVRVFIKRKE